MVFFFFCQLLGPDIILSDRDHEPDLYRCFQNQTFQSKTRPQMLPHTTAPHKFPPHSCPKQLPPHTTVLHRNSIQGEPNPQPILVKPHYFHKHTASLEHWNRLLHRETIFIYIFFFFSSLHVQSRDGERPFCVRVFCVAELALSHRP